MKWPSSACHEEQARQIPDARVAIIPNRAHPVPLEKPAGHTAALEEFIQ